MPRARTAVVPSDVPVRSLSINEARALLGRDADDMSDADVREVCRLADQIAHVIVQMFRAARTPRPM